MWMSMAVCLCTWVDGCGLKEEWVGLLTLDVVCVCVHVCVHKSVYIWISRSTCPWTCPWLQLGVYLHALSTFAYICARVSVYEGCWEKSLQICKCVSEQNSLSTLVCLHLCISPCAHVCLWDRRCWESPGYVLCVCISVCILMDGVGLCFCLICVSSCAMIETVSYQPWPFTCPDSCYLHVHLY